MDADYFFVWGVQAVWEMPMSFSLPSTSAQMLLQDSGEMSTFYDVTAQGLTKDIQVLVVSMIGFKM